MNYKKSDPFMVLAESRIDAYQGDCKQKELIKKAKSITYYIPKLIAHQLCAELREATSGQWFTPQFWRCQRCMLFNQSGIPRGLVTSEKNQYACPAMAKRYGHDLS